MGWLANDTILLPLRDTITRKETNLLTLLSWKVVVGMPCWQHGKLLRKVQGHSYDGSIPTHIISLFEIPENDNIWQTLIYIDSKKFKVWLALGENYQVSYTKAKHHFSLNIFSS
jgi:hypothetical protein